MVRTGSVRASGCIAPCAFSAPKVCTPYSRSSHQRRASAPRALQEQPQSRSTRDRTQAGNKTIARRVNVPVSDGDFAATPARRYINFTGFPFPIGPVASRKTTCRELVKGTMWSFEQPQSLAFSNVAVNIRMTVVRLSSGGLLIYNPIAPTPECLALLADLGAPVQHIILGSAAYEHKVFVGPFQRRFRNADVWVAPQQWSFPLNLPVQFFGIFPKGVLKHNDTATPWAADLEQKVLRAPQFAVAGLYSEVALFHKASRTVLVTDAVVQLPRRPPDCISPETLLDNAKNGFVIRTADAIYGEDDITGRIYDGQPVVDTPSNRLKGWQRICLLVCFFGPSKLYDPEESFNLYAGRPFVFPVVSQLVYKRVPESVREWVEEIARDWNFNKIVPAHFDAPVSCGPRELVAAFQRSSTVYQTPSSAAAAEGSAAARPEKRGLLQQLLALRQAGSRPGESILDPADLKALNNINGFLEAIRAVKPPPKP